MQLYPLLFRHVYRDYLWGGDRIARRFGRTDAPARCGESWEISSHPDGPGIVANGPLAGRDLQSLCDEFGPALVGTAAEGARFPLLIKIIDARQKLSVQVHPSDENAAAVGGEAKTEMWYVLDADPGSKIYCGLRDCPGPRTLRDALLAHRVPELLVAYDSEPGSAMFVPGGTVHAIGDGNLIFEVQQNSNTTYRVFDWDRVDDNGRARELHVDKAVSVIQWRAPASGFLRPVAEPDSASGNRRSRILRSDFFELRSTLLRVPETTTLDGTTFHALFVLDGAARLDWPGMNAPIELPLGTSCLVPASLGSYALAPSGDSSVTILTTTI